MFKEIKKLHKQGYKNIAGLDEAGRGPLAGPVVAAAVAATTKRLARSDKRLVNIRDSKKLSARQRDEWYKVLTRHQDLQWGVGIVSEKVIDKINILEATKLAMAKAIKELGIRNQESGITNIDYLIIDGNFTLESEDYWSSKRKFARKGADSRPLFQQKAIVKADEKIFLCAAASIIVKVTRDKIMLKMHKKYPQYGFAQHKGYGTKEHLRALKKYGACGIHRKSFGPVKIGNRELGTRN